MLFYRFIIFISVYSWNRFACFSAQNMVAPHEYPGCSDWSAHTCLTQHRKQKNRAAVLNQILHAKLATGRKLSTINYIWFRRGASDSADFILLNFQDLFTRTRNRYKTQTGRKLKNYKSKIDLSGLKWNVEQHKWGSSPYTRALPAALPKLNECAASLIFL